MEGGSFRRGHCGDSEEGGSVESWAKWKGQLHVSPFRSSFSASLTWLCIQNDGCQVVLGSYNPGARHAGYALRVPSLFCSSAFFEKRDNWSIYGHKFAPCSLWSPRHAVTSLQSGVRRQPRRKIVNEGASITLPGMCKLSTTGCLKGQSWTWWNIYRHQCPVTTLKGWTPLRWVGGGAWSGYGQDTLFTYMKLSESK